MSTVTKLFLSAAAALALGVSAAHAQPGPGYGGGPEGYGPGMGPGMMGGYGYGGGYGPGYGRGRGMMGGYGAIGALNLNDQQRAQIAKIQDELRKKNWELAGQTQDEMAKLRDAYWAGKRDRTAILGAYKRIGDLRLKRIENSLDAYDKIDAVLTPEQREQLKRFGPRAMMDDE